MSASQKLNYENTQNKFSVVWKDFVQLFYIYNFEGYSHDISVFRKICVKTKTIFIFFSGLLHFFF